jgi:hypothetical protein
MDPGADHSRQGDASRIEAAQAQPSEQPKARAAGDAGRREQDAVVREALADLRESKADQRDREADRREREADQREAVADLREREADEREEQMRALIGELRGLVTGAQRDALEAIESSLGLLSASADSFQRGEEAVRRATGRRRREEEATARGQAGRQWAYSSPAGPAREIRARLSATIAAFAVAEDNTARVFDQLAAGHPDDAGAYQRKAQQARETADRARELSRKLAG